MYYRKKWGRGFTYLNENGETIKEPEIKEWILSLVIPPAWTEVEISSSKRAKVLATGRDDKNRKQYIYNPTYINRQNQKKFKRIVRFAEKLDHMRKVTDKHLGDKNMSKRKVCAAMLKLMDYAYFRPGSDVYAKRNGTYGLTTMRSKHLTIEDDTLEFNYMGKSGVEQTKVITDDRLAKVIQDLDDLPGYRIFKFIDSDGSKHEISNTDLNEYIREVMGEAFSAKDFRTWAGTMVAAIALDELGITDKEDISNMDKNIKDAIIRVSEMLGNTPSVARSSYVDPIIIDSYLDGKTVSFFAGEAKELLESTQNLSDEERLVLCMLKNAPE